MRNEMTGDSENERGEKILVEMQRGEQQFFKDRSIYYSTFPIREQGLRGEWDYELKAVYIIGILNFRESGTMSLRLSIS